MKYEYQHPYTLNPTPGFVAVFFDIPFPLSIANGAYLTYDPVKEIACIEVTLIEGSRAFFRNRPIIGPTSFENLRTAAQEYERPREDHSYMATSVLHDGTRKATLNVHTGVDGGYMECKYYSKVCVTFLADDISITEGVFDRVGKIPNPFLDKYRLLNEDYRVSMVSLEQNFYLGTCHTSPLTSAESHLTSHELFQRLQEPRPFSSILGNGAFNILRANSYELLGPKSPLPEDAQSTFEEFIREEYEMPLSYDLIMEALRCLQKSREYKLAIIHAETAFEVYVSQSLLKLMIISGI